MPTDDTDLETAFTCTDYSKVESDDDIYVQQCATDEYALFLFKKQAMNSKGIIILEWKGKTSRACSSSPVYLQIYNRTSKNWETLDSNNTAAANTEFTLSGKRTTNLEEYYDENNWIAYRVYQKAQWVLVQWKKK